MAMEKSLAHRRKSLHWPLAVFEAAVLGHCFKATWMLSSCIVEGKALSVPSIISFVAASNSSGVFSIQFISNL
jgi:hypothetical protein